MRRFLGLSLLLVLSGTATAVAGWRDLTVGAFSASSGTLPAPSGLTATPSCLLVLPRVTLGWTRVTAASAYAVHRRTGGGAYSQIATVGGAASSYVDSSVALGTNYTYYLVASVGGWSATTSTVSVSTPVVCL